MNFNELRKIGKSAQNFNMTRILSQNNTGKLQLTSPSSGTLNNYATQPTTTKGASTPNATSLANRRKEIIQKRLGLDSQELTRNNTRSQVNSFVNP